MSSTIGFSETRASLDDDVLGKDLRDKVNNLYVDVHSMKNEFAKWLKEMQDALNTKADHEALSNLEKLLMERLDEIVKALTK